MNLKFFDIEPRVIQPLKKRFHGVEGISCEVRDFMEIPDEEFDMFVSPANSFGIMNGGIDGVYTRKYGNILQDKVSVHIREHFAGIQPVGTCFSVFVYAPKRNEEDADETKIHQLLHAPTMMYPMTLRTVENVYMAFKAVLLESHFTQAKESDMTIMCPGLGTCTGAVDPEDAADAMRQAYDDVLLVRGYYNWDQAFRKIKQLGI
jgi:O-acetyl-ADP-ribose deacetylase (regulator of RNase III)